jgi:hypothetical protein
LLPARLNLKSVRIPFPERIPLSRVAIFAAVLCAIQLAEGTAPYFSAGCVVFIMIAAVAFNLGGGLSRVSGAYVFFYSILVVIVGITYKAILGEPAQSHLQDPVTDIEVYLAGITAMLGAVVVSRRFSRKQALLQNILKESQMYRSSVGCIVVGIFGQSVIALLGESGGGLVSAFNQLNLLTPLGIIIGSMYEIRRTAGRRSTNLIMILGGAYDFFLGGILAFSKQGLFTAPLCWLLAVCALGFRLSARQVLFFSAALFVIIYYLVPYDQYGRSAVREGMTQGQRLDVSVSLLKDPDKTRQLYLQGFKDLENNGLSYGGYFNEQQGFMDRMQFVSVDDSLVAFTQQTDTTVGIGPVTESFANAIPRVFWPSKPAPHFGGNFYVHEMGGLSDEDTTTGISFSPTAEAFHMGKWVGVMVIAPLLWFLTFVICDSLFGDLRATPWGLLVLVQLAHTAPEGALSGLVHFLTFGVEILVFCAVFATWVAPIFAIPILGPDRRKGVPRLSLSPDPQEAVMDEPA